jgi:hypothetical protein
MGVGPGHRFDATEQDGDAIKTKVVSRLHAWVILSLSLSLSLPRFFFRLPLILSMFLVPGGTGRFTFFFFFFLKKQKYVQPENYTHV